MTDSNVDHVEVFKSDAGRWCWHAIARNGEIVSQGESHTRAEDAARAASSVMGDQVRITLRRETD
jgi:uncharacterized protein YegP (UPF0339 family)